MLSIPVVIVGLLILHESPKVAVYALTQIRIRYAIYMGQDGQHIVASPARTAIVPRIQ